MHQSIATIDSPEFINLEPLDINPLMSKCEIKVFYLGENRNHSYITKDVATEMAKTLRGAPIVGYYKDSKEDFADHGEKVTFDDEGIHFECMTRPYGFVAPDAKVWFQKFDDYDDFGNSVTREYLMTTGYLWTGQYEECKSVVEGDGKPHSMELDEETLDGRWSENIKTGMDFFIINDAIISKLCVLGDDVEPCFEDAQFITAFSNMVSAYALYIEEAQKNNEGGKNIMDNIAEIVEPEVATNQVEEEATEIVETKEVEVTEAVEPEVKTEEVAEVETEEETEEVEEETEVVETVEDTAEGTEFESKKSDDKKEDEEDEDVCPKCGKNPCVCESSCKKKKDYSALEAELADYKAKYESLENKYNDALSSLNKYTKKEKLEIINKFSTKLEREELIEKLTAEVDNYTLDEIKNELGQALVEQLSAEEEAESNDTDSNFSLNINIADNSLGNSAWDLVKRHKANK